jgi:hypothetical protein
MSTTAANLTTRNEGQSFLVHAATGFAGRSLTFRGRTNGFPTFEGPNGERVFVAGTAPVVPAK